MLRRSFRFCQVRSASGPSSATSGLLDNNTTSVKVDPFVPFIVHTAGKTNLPEIAKEVVIESAKPLEWFSFMSKMRRMEQNSDICYKEKLIKGFLHLYSGQEAIPVGMGEILAKDDAIITAYRCHMWHVARGGTIAEVFAEMFGMQQGCSKGKGGSMHMYNAKGAFFGGNGIVGAQVPVGAGLAWSYAYKNGTATPKNMCVALYGDGAASQGQIFEAYNMAALWKLPCLFVCENNHYGMGTAQARHSANTQFFRRCEYIPGLRADGNNVFSVMAATKYAREYILGGNGPMIIEFDTYRYSGHSMSDPGLAYRTPDEVKTMRETRDPIAFVGKYITDNGLGTDKDLKKLTKAANDEVDDIMEKVKETGRPTDMSELYKDVLAQPEKYHASVRFPQGTHYHEY